MTLEDRLNRAAIETWIAPRACSKMGVAVEASSPNRRKRPIDRRLRAPHKDGCLVWGGTAPGGFVPTSTRDRASLPDAPEGPPSRQELEALANFRYTLRKFLAFSEGAAAEVGLTAQWYQALLVIKTYRGDDHISVGELAEQLMIRDHSAAELVSRLAQAKLVRRKTDPDDRRRSLIVMTPLGNRRLDQLALVHLQKLRENRGAFLNLFDIDTACGDSPDGRESADER